MKHIGWNCRGLGNPRSVHTLGDLIKSHIPTLLFLSETLVRGDIIPNISRRFGFSGFFAVDAVGRTGGLAVLWESNISCTVIGSSRNYIDMHILEKNIPSWRLTCYYGFPEIAHHQEAWNLLRQLAQINSLPWCIFGDFNDLLYASDKSGNHPHPQGLLEGFRTAVQECSLTELELIGGMYTWEKRQRH
ncbi:uncharacterized protein LOC141683655 [Apium graveolens]|uniref:uncharacterized protein LOC141683655 n=1 Tax=Apium graveolens TaxID=4045 RepID=UPI003D798E05